MSFIEQWNDFYSRVDDVAVTLNLYPISGSAEEVRVGMPLHQAITQPAGMFSAPALFGLADICGTWLAMQQVPRGVFPLAVSSSVNVVSNKKEGDAVATATIVRAGRTVIVTDTVVRSSVDDAVLAKVVTTYTVPQPKA
ncbi:PaaI family thioesterase [Corynebacterium sp.]|uniref:PaaI family thioesterase n=1 Tax=Corynebacterium sp. TaxID=1720 RepID=UPI0026DB9D85|nr:PaaI family thioesterase [Corynebacterium sp.]MDO5076951.1 PaaI family thioesterase [Corynebacterium sp.]